MKVRSQEKIFDHKLREKYFSALRYSSAPSSWCWVRAVKELVSLLRRMWSCRRIMKISSIWWTVSCGTVRTVRAGCTGEVRCSSLSLHGINTHTSLPPHQATWGWGDRGSSLSTITTAVRSPALSTGPSWTAATTSSAGRASTPWRIAWPDWASWGRPTRFINFKLIPTLIIDLPVSEWLYLVKKFFQNSIFSQCFQAKLYL